MGSLADLAADQETDRQIEQNREYLRGLSFEIVTEIEPYGPDFENRKWLEENKEKIIRNRRLIDVLG